MEHIVGLQTCSKIADQVILKNNFAFYWSATYRRLNSCDKLLLRLSWSIL